MLYFIGFIYLYFEVLILNLKWFNVQYVGKLFFIARKTV